MPLTANLLKKVTNFAVKFNADIMIIKRDEYITQLVSKSWNNKVKIITGIRRCGKSFLLNTLFRNYLLENGVSEDEIISIDLEKKSDAKYRNPIALLDFVIKRARNQSGRYYVFIDEIQMAAKIKNPDLEGVQASEEDGDLLYITFYDVLNELISKPNLDVYVTGSNSRMLSKDIVTNFRDRGTEIKIYPLSFAEFYNVSNEEKADAFESYMRFGGMPSAVIENDEKEKMKYLKELHNKVYFKDIVERYKLKDDTVLDALVNSLYSAVGSLTNVHNLANAASTLMQKGTSDNTIKSYIDFLEDAYLMMEAKRYDIKGKKYFEYPQKYYAMDIGLRNAKLNFRQIDSGHIMENILFIELIRRGYSVDVGMVKINSCTTGKKMMSQHEIDFIVNTGTNKIYIQSAWNLDSRDKEDQETLSLKNTGDFFRKIVVTGGNGKMWTDENGITYIGVIPFLLQDIL